MNNLLDLARTSGTPIVDRQTVTFLWEGEQAPSLIADFNDWGQSPIQLVRVGEKTWIHKERLSNDAYIEYAYLNLESEERIDDPYNPRKSQMEWVILIISSTCLARFPIY